MAYPILVVEDDPSVRGFIAMALDNEGYSVITADNGAIALRLVEEHRPSLILLDMRMPVLDGWGFLQKYCATSETAAPIIAMSAHVRNPQGLDCVNAFLEKPFDLDKLLELVQTNIRT